MKDNNKGFSYVELILVLAIMSIMIGMIGLSIGLVTRNNVTKAAAKMESAFNTARITSLSKGSEQGAINIMQENGAVYYCIGKFDPEDPNCPEWKKIAQSPVRITMANGSDHYDLADGSILVYKYNPSSGAFKTDTFPYSQIIFTNGSKESSLILYKTTGKCKVQ